MRIPSAFVSEMQLMWDQLRPEGTLADFLAALSEAPAMGLRANTLKITPQDLIQLLGVSGFTPVPWSISGFYSPPELMPGRLSAYHAGLYYIQEPSAMLPAEVLNPTAGDCVLDLCAAPGGKSSRLAAMVGPEGLLWSNEISADRVKALLRNLELMGIDRCVITQETPEHLAERLPSFFDKILVDAPCSGSGMFRRDPAAAGSWEKYGSNTCIPIQKDILEAADRMLKPGGFLVYSTCSFSVSEDEGMISNFLDRHPDYQIVPIHKTDQTNSSENRGSPALSDGLAVTPEMTGTARIWPHRTRGDGHFCALLHKQPMQSEQVKYHETAARLNSTIQSTVDTTRRSGREDRHSKSSKRPVSNDPIDSGIAVDRFKNWAGSVLSEDGLAKLAKREERAYFRLHQNHLHLAPDLAGSLTGLRYVKTGLYLGQIKTGSAAVFEPAHAFLLTLEAQDLRYALQLPSDHPVLMRYLRGETIAWPEQLQPPESWPANAWVAICLNQFPVGWARTTTPGQLKNLYPPAWRRLN